jgi:hypothetical protein
MIVFPRQDPGTYQEDGAEWGTYCDAMPNRRADDRAPACILDEHDNCPHLNGYGSMLNLRRLRFEPSALLCKCDCHSSCPLAGKRTFVREQTWQESCTCPGAEDERPRRDPAAVQARRPPQPLHEVSEAVRAKAADQSPEQIKDLIKAELHARGVRIPQEEVLDGPGLHSFAISVNRFLTVNRRAAKWSNQVSNDGCPPVTDTSGHRWTAMPGPGRPHPWQSASLVAFGMKRPPALPSPAVSV